ncbi:zinc finger protein 276 isoform X2 [Syngnathoides biaculeatus]|uniref:zinc finger protein 276 isoform X2 n=1 Tax=Syngnathoides biaculeatus TaxID=300417 RepID=UPI002ADE0175|nr:zinc finger protein 276 isoform X2 [Syngnathoides biaculeatus]
MKKKGRCPRSPETSRKNSRVCEGKSPCGKLRENNHVTAATSNLYDGDAPSDATNILTDKDSDVKSKAFKLSTAICRLCHGKFSPRSLLHAFNKCPEDYPDIFNEEAYAAAKSPSLFHIDFQRLVGVQLDPDPQLSEFVCKKCHSKFYKCQNILLRFLQMVNLLPVGKDNSKMRHMAMLSDSSINDGSITSPSFSLDIASLHKLVSWAHHHGKACKSCPDLKQLLEEQCWDSVKAVWYCLDGHSYTMNTQGTTSIRFGYVLNPRESETCAKEISGEVDCAEKRTVGMAGPQAEHSLPAVTPLIQTSTLAADWTCNTKEFGDTEVAISPVQEQQGDMRTNTELSDREELPNIYKCLYQGCTAVYRTSEGLKKHIKEHHEEIRERPCPHPGCNKVFTIDRYLQRHVKLIHTEERNYICDQCGQTFKQRKHLSVHQMRHSGVKPLQCEVCGFQCRQRASLKYHMTKHKAEADLDFACLICCKRFEKAHNLNVHMSMVHPLTQTKLQKGGNKLKPHTTVSNLHNILTRGQEQDR